MSENVLTAIANVMQKIEYVHKSKKMETGAKYSYAGESDFIDTVRPAMVDNGLILVIEDIKDFDTIQYESKNNTAMNQVSFTIVGKFYHAPSGSSIQVSARGAGADSGDKSTPKAMTGAYKYLLRQSFCLETGDDPDKQPSSEQERGTSVKPKPAQEQPEQKSSEAHDLEWANKQVSPGGKVVETFKGVDDMKHFKENYKSQMVGDFLEGFNIKIKYFEDGGK